VAFGGGASIVVVSVSATGVSTVPAAPVIVGLDQELASISSTIAGNESTARLR
jgi:hypothetical protein